MLLWRSEWSDKPNEHTLLAVIKALQQQKAHSRRWQGSGLPDPALQLRQQVPSIQEKQRQWMTESVSSPKGIVSSLASSGLIEGDCVPGEEPLNRRVNQRNWSKSIKVDVQPLMCEGILAQETAVLCPREPKWIVGHILGGEEIHLNPAKDVPETEQHHWMEPPFSQMLLVMGNLRSRSAPSASALLSGQLDGGLPKSENTAARSNLTDLVPP